MKIRAGNIRRAMRAVAKERGFGVGQIEYSRHLPLAGAFWPATKKIAISVPSSERGGIMQTAAHELAHAGGIPKEGRQHKKLENELYQALKARALDYAQKDRGQRKSASGSWDESLHPRDNEGKFENK